MSPGVTLLRLVAYTSIMTTFTGMAASLGMAFTIKMTLPET